MEDKFKLPDSRVPPYHEKCGGRFFYTQHPRGPLEERVCLKCGAQQIRQVSYEPNLLVIIGKSGVPQKVFDKIILRCNLTLVNTGKSKNDSSVFITEIELPTTKNFKSIEEWIKILEKHRAIAAVCQKPKVEYILIEPEKTITQ